ncbi:hypothetical protein [Enemella sp. A6]|uniref:hypothetical protein n=1 Tax=Enemella sp. A6 TaxID=3440152 RepID=UPI003EBE4E2E
MPVYEIVQAVEACQQAEGLGGGINAAASVGSAGLEVIGAVMNPVAAVVKAPLEFLLDWILSWCTPLREVVDALLGDPAAIRTNGDDWIAVGEMLEQVGLEHQGTIGDFPGWTGDGADAYRNDVHPYISQVFSSAAGTAKSFGDTSIMVGGIIGALREIIWGAIVDLLAEVIASALIALAASVPSLGGSIATFTGWCAARMSSMFMWMGSKLRHCGGVLGKIGDVMVKMGDEFGKAAKAMGQLSGKFRAGAATSQNFRTTFNQVSQARSHIPGLPESVGAGTSAAGGATQTDRE